MLLFCFDRRPRELGRVNDLSFNTLIITASYESSGTIGEVMTSTNTDMGTKHARPQGSLSLHQMIFSELDVQRRALAHELLIRRPPVRLDRPIPARNTCAC